MDKYENHIYKVSKEDVGEANAALILEKEWGHEIPSKIMEVGLLRKAGVSHMN